MPPSKYVGTLKPGVPFSKLTDEITRATEGLDGKVELTPTSGRDFELACPRLLADRVRKLPCVSKFRCQKAAT